MLLFTESDFADCYGVAQIGRALGRAPAFETHVLRVARMLDHEPHFPPFHILADVVVVGRVVLFASVNPGLVLRQHAVHFVTESRGYG